MKASPIFCQFVLVMINKEISLTPQKRQKWNQIKDNLKPDDIVFNIIDATYKNYWAFGKVLKVYLDKTKSTEAPKCKLNILFLKDLSINCIL